jgi:hypothetical protein
MRQLQTALGALSALFGIPWHVTLLQATYPRRSPNCDSIPKVISRVKNGRVPDTSVRQQKLYPYHHGPFISFEGRAKQHLRDDEQAGGIKKAPPGGRQSGAFQTRSARFVRRAG